MERPSSNELDKSTREVVDYLVRNYGEQLPPHFRAERLLDVLGVRCEAGPSQTDRLYLVAPEDDPAFFVSEMKLRALCLVIERLVKRHLSALKD